MKEFKDILSRLERAGRRAVLATVVKTQGSTYRRPGARMLIEEDGQTVGLVSGGCLDSDLLERARRVLGSNSALVVEYDSIQDADSMWGLGLGCPGRVQVLIEPADSKECRQMLGFVESCLTDRSRGVVATVIRSESESLAKVPQRLLLRDSGMVASEIHAEPLTTKVLSDATSALESGRPAHGIYEHADAAVELFFEPILPQTSLVIFGAGPDAVPVVQLATELGWDVTVIDHRPAFATKDNFPRAGSVILTEPGTIPAVSLAPDTVALIMTHNYSHDALYLKHLLQSPVFYIGLLGPTTKSSMLLQKLQEQGFHPSSEQLGRLYTPVGLDIGAETPEEIALSIIAEIQAVLGERRGGFLKERKAPIH